MPLYEHLPTDVRSIVDAWVEDLWFEPWPSRFLALLGLLTEKLDTCAFRDRSLMIQQWSGLVTATLERLPPNSSVVECLGLMSISFNDQWRAEALAQIERDPTVVDRLIRLYPAWDEIVVSVLAAVETRPIRPPPALHS